MRKLISTLVGMADGVFNVDEDAFAGVGGAPTMKTDNGQEINVLKGVTWNDPKNLMEQPNLKFSPGANDKSRNSYDVQIGKDGGVTLKCERYLTTHVKQMGDSDGSPLNLSIGEEADGVKIMDYKVVTVVTISPEQMAAVKLEQGEIPDFRVKSVTTEFV